MDKRLRVFSLLPGTLMASSPCLVYRLCAALYNADGLLTRVAPDGSGTT
jgi:hypothetical protein